MVLHAASSRVAAAHANAITLRIMMNSFPGELFGGSVWNQSRCRANANAPAGRVGVARSRMKKIQYAGHIYPRAGNHRFWRAALRDSPSWVKTSFIFSKSLALSKK